jgi:hypothetical protein
MHRKYVLVVPLVLALVGSISVVGIAHATNESSYKYGYFGGKSEWDSCAHTDGEGDCTAAFDYCANPTTWANGTVAYNVGQSDPTNITACIHGYVHAWNHFCDPVVAKKADTMSCPLSQHDMSPP